MNEATSMTERLARALDAHIEGPDRLTMEDAIALRDELRRLSADARRYRQIRDTPWPEELRSVIVLQQNARWDAAIDQAMDGK